MYCLGLIVLLRVVNKKVKTMNPIQGDILFKLCQQVNERIWYHDTATDCICYVANDGQNAETIPFDEHMAMKHPDDRQQVYECMEYMILHHAPYPHPLMIRYRDSSQPDGYRYTLNAITPVFEGNVIHVVGSEQDITSMVRKQQLAENQSKLIEELLHKRREDTWTVCRKTDKIHINRQDGTEVEMTLDRFIESLDMDESQDAVNAIEGMRKGESKIMEFHLKEKKARKDSNRHYFKCISMPSKYDYLGNVIEYVGVGADVTLEVADKRRLSQALAEAKEQSRKKSVFVAQASHDLRNPLNVLLNLSEMMCMDLPLEERQELNEMMKQSGETLLLLINDILDLSHIENEMQFSHEDFDAKEMVEDVIQSYEISTGKSHNIILEADVTVPTINSDRKRLAQIVGNYLSNAIKYSPGGSDILVTMRNNEEGLYIAVTDHGCGIAPDDHNRVFDEFARFNTEVNGTGLGLSICKHIAEGLGGSVGFDSQEGKGSTFWVKI